MFTIFQGFGCARICDDAPPEGDAPGASPLAGSGSDPGKIRPGSRPVLSYLNNLKQCFVFILKKKAKKIYFKTL